MEHTVQSSPFRLGQRPCLDGLRGFAVLLVVVSHLNYLPGGFVGVETLFVLSGFLITVMLIEEREKRGEISLRNFYRKRFRRVLPPLAALLVIASGVSVLLGLRPPGAMAWEAATTAVFFTNCMSIHNVDMPILGHTWTLALEVQFYLIWPVAFYLLLKAGVRRERILLVLAAGILASMTWRLAMYCQRPPSGHARSVHLLRLFTGLDTHMDTLLVGCLVGALIAWNRYPSTGIYRTLLQYSGFLSLAGMLAMVRFCHLEQHALYCGLFTLTGIMVANVIAWLMLAPPKLLLCALDNPLPVGLGRISYAVYLFHMPLITWLKPRSLHDSLLVLALTLVASTLSFFLIERPVIRAKRRIEQEQSRKKETGAFARPLFPAGTFSRPF